jgi:acetyl-CoA synthetase
MLDCPPEQKADTASFDAVIDVFIDAAGGTSTRAALIASLPETLSERIRRRCLDGGVIPLQGQREALEALASAGAVGEAWRAGPGVKLQSAARSAAPAQLPYTLSEIEGKRILANFGVSIPRGACVAAAAAAQTAASLGFPVVMKAVGAHLKHKTEVGGVVLNVRTLAEADAAVARLAGLSDTILVEAMITDGVAEILVGVIVDPQFGQVLVLGAGGILTELLSDSVSLLPPWTRTTIEAGLNRLAVARLLEGYRGKPAGDVDALIGTVLAVGRYASSTVPTLIEIDVNPVIVRPPGQGAVAVDTMIRLYGFA